MDNNSQSDSRSVIALNDVLRTQFSKGEGVICLQPGMSDATLAATIRHAASFGKPFTVVPPEGDIFEAGRGFGQSTVLAAQNADDLKRPEGGGGSTPSYSQFFEVDMGSVLLDRFANGDGIIQLLPDMDVKMIALIIKYAASFGKPFTVLPPTKEKNTTHEEAMQAGKDAAIAALAESTRPLLIMDEMCSSEEETAFAMGWNSVWASEENKQRWEAFKAERQQN